MMPVIIVAEPYVLAAMRIAGPVPERIEQDSVSRQQILATRRGWVTPVQQARPLIPGNFER